MYLKRLELHGFKSFARRTVLEFDPGITAIVGPNGCGKSNIVDAVRWVIGEQRARILRSEKMENVIFNGTAKRRPVGMAEVQLTIENNRGVLPTEYNEVMLGRRLYRSGDSEYLLNDVQCRLKDIVELFMDTGMGADAYSVIELKMVDEILSDSAQDRRRMFEEAAGITKYKQRRRQALRKLENTQADLTRVRDLTSELDSRVRRLKRQANRAEKAREIEQRLHTLELSLAQLEYDRLSKQETAFQEEIETLQQELDQYTARLSNEEAQREALRTTLVGQEQEVSERQQRYNEHVEQVRSLEARLELTRERFSTARREQARTQAEYEEAAERLGTLGKEKQRQETAVAEQKPVVEEMEEAFARAQEERDQRRAALLEARETLKELQQQEANCIDEHASTLRKQDRLTNRIELWEEERQRVQKSLEALGETAREHAARQATATATYQDTLRTREAAEARLQEAEMQQAKLHEAMDEARHELRRAERERDAAAAEVALLESLVASYEAFSDSVQFLAQEPGWNSGDLVTVADVLSCDETDRAALNAALGAYASCIVVPTEQEVHSAAALLRREEKGQATFLVLSRLKRPEGETSRVRGASPLSDRVRTLSPTYDILASVLLQGCYLVDTLEEALRRHATADGGACFVARTGEWVDSNGAIHAGNEGANGSSAAGRLGRREQLETAREEYARLDERLVERAAAVDRLEKEVAALPLAAARAELETARKSANEAQSAQERVSLALEAARDRQNENRSRLDELARDSARAREQSEQMKQPLKHIEERLARIRAERAEAEGRVQQAEEQSRDAQDRFSRASLADVEARNELSTRENRLGRALEAIEQTEVLMKRRQAHLNALQETITTSEQEHDTLASQLREIRNERTDLEKAVSDAKTAMMETRVAIDKVDSRLRALRSSREERMRKVNERSVRLAEVRTRSQDLLESILEDYERNLAEEPFEVDESLDLDEARDEVKALRSQRKRLGSINALALDEYEEESERLEFLSTQQADLEEAEETLLTTIDEINATAAERFESTFSAIQTNFRALFGELFGDEATAELELEDPDDPLESAIEIMAKPRGKRPISITQLSSGEKTLTAIALLFAIYQEKPSPFCLLDEVDAPLDDANVGRFMKLIRRFAEDTQFILVTHNKRTMEMADRLYGITMQEQGVSELVGVRFDEALQYAD